MSVWTQIETAPASAALFNWKIRFGEDLARVQPWFLKKTDGTARTIVCPHNCGCFHRVTKDGGHAVCNCGDCEEIPPTAGDTEVWEPNWASLGSRVREAFDLEHKTSRFPVSNVWQIGSFGGDALQIVLVVQPDRVAFNEALAQLVARAPGRFVVLTPTNVHHDLESRELVRRVHAGMIELESSMTILAPGRLVARKSAGELFSPYLPENQAAPNATEVSWVFGILMKLKSKRAGMKAPLYDVFVHLVLEGNSQRAAAKICDCAEGLMSGRVKELVTIFKRSLKELKALRTPIVEMQTSVKGDRKRKRAPGSPAGKFADDDKPDEEADGAPKEEYIYDEGEKKMLEF